MVGVDKMSYYIRLCLLCFIVMIWVVNVPITPKMYFVLQQRCVGFRSRRGGGKKNAIT